MKPLTVAYLINRYPRASHSFIRREIAALEALGLTIARFSIRPVESDEVVDDADRAEASKTRIILAGGPLALVGATFKALFTRPAAFFSAVNLAIRTGRGGDRGLLINLIYLAEACVLLSWLKECNADHLHAHFGTNSTAVAMLCAALGGPPYSFTAHGPEEFDRPQALRLGEKIARAKFVVAISDFGRSQLYRWCPYGDWSKVHVVRCGVDEMFLAAAKSTPSQTPRLVCIGRLAPQKGQAILIQAAAKLAAEGQNVELVLVGDGPLRAAIEGMSKTLHLNGQLNITGWMSGPQVRDQLEQARAMVLPSFAEGLPVVIMESLALARPVISTHVAGIPELMQDGVNGWLVAPGDVDALAAAMRKALTADAATLAKMGNAGRERVAERHNVMIEAGKLKALFGGKSGDR
jgi:glycosyltransferase involved in cell wall biosynthesis